MRYAVPLPVPVLGPAAAPLLRMPPESGRQRPSRPRPQARRAGGVPSPEEQRAPAGPAHGVPPRDAVPRTSAPSMLHRLAHERATGAFTRAGGTLFLVEGRIAHAESPAAPALELLLTGAGCPSRTGRRHPAAPPDVAPSASAPPAEMDTHAMRSLVEAGRVPGGTLELCARLALYDAAFFVLESAGGPGRFRKGVRHWLGGTPGAAGAVTLAAAERETARRRALLDRIWPDARLDVLPPVPTAAVARTDTPPAASGAPARTAAGGGAGLVPARRLAVLELADGVRNATDLARVLGRPAFHTLVDLRRLAAAGLVVAQGTGARTDTGGRPVDLVPVRTPEATPRPTSAIAPPSDPRLAPPRAAAAEPSQTTMAEPPAGAPGEGAAVAPPAVFPDPDVALLRRLRDALEAL
ncbi:hypothetical protein ABZ820_25635 [Streptomyces diacarni]|uniref:hypothetical protein n=1 Tax=Streptomyces diacarni TaxID=2800381 RepID=UPI0033C4BE17